MKDIKTKLKIDMDFLHQNPEISWKEFRTTTYLKNRLESMNIKTTVFDDVTGVIGIWQGESQKEDEKGLVVGLRSDIDALWQELDGEWKAIHSCGHDAHMTIVLGALEILRSTGFQPKGTLKIIFQPAEENGTGALKMIEKGVVDDLDYLYGIHLRPIQEMAFGKASSAIYNGAALLVRGEIYGTPAHGARPHLGVNVIDVAAHFVQLLNSIHTDPMVPATVKMTQLRAGGENVNVIPGYAEFALDIRAQTNVVLNEIYENVVKRANGLAELYGARIELDPSNKIAAAEVNEEARALMAQAINEVLGAENLVHGIITPGGEDFHFYTLHNKSIKATMLGLGSDLQPGLHHPKMSFNPLALMHGARILAEVIKNTFERREK